MTTISAAALACLKHSARKSATGCPCARCAEAAEIDHANAETSKATEIRAFELLMIISLSGFRDDAPRGYSAISGDHLVEEEESPSRKIGRLVSAFGRMMRQNVMTRRSPCFGFFRISLPTQQNSGAASRLEIWCPETRRLQDHINAVRRSALATLALDASAASSADGRLTLLAGLVRTIRIALPSGAPRCALRVCRGSERYHAHCHCD